ncbi:MAG: response regulator [Acidobacteriaceae bacterium]|nr:response regulator [Acidobacteriaceae bacterium]
MLWIDDYEPGLSVYSAIFEGFGFRVITATRPAIGLALAATEKLDAAIVDYEMPEMDGGAVTAELKRQHPQLPVILFSGSTIFPTQLRTLVDAICDKAEPFEWLLATVNAVIGKKSLNALQQLRLRQPSEEGQSAIA